MSVHEHHPMVSLPSPSAHPVLGYPCGSERIWVLAKAGHHQHQPQQQVLVVSSSSAGHMGAVSRDLRKLQDSVDHTLGHADSWAAAVQEPSPVLLHCGQVAEFR